MLHLNWHNYKYYPYEKELAAREARELLQATDIAISKHGLTVDLPSNGNFNGNEERLVYVSSFQYEGEGVSRPTLQAQLERVNGNGPKRQSTRYSAHGLHEYKGKFNPQIAKAILNLFHAKKGDHALDPFCGSGTSLIEASHLGIRATGTDINPLAVFIANAKVSALGTPAETLIAEASAVIKFLRGNRTVELADSPRIRYLRDWFPESNLLDIERLRLSIEAEAPEARNILLAIASNLLRDYSLQEPSDLRIRRRTSPFPETPLLVAFESSVLGFSRKLKESQQVLGLISPLAEATLLDCRETLETLASKQKGGFDLALTSPPYATALPYIDTQRLSLVWLNLLSPADILTLESRLVGSREIRGQGKSELLSAMLENQARLPSSELELCIEMQEILGDSDGFRRQAMPRLLYRYFAGMADSFAAVRSVMKPGAMYGLIVGGNHTVLGGRRFDIDTPGHLANLAESRGWEHVETIGLQAYQRFGLHAKNAGTTEALVILKALNN